MTLKELATREAILKALHDAIGEELKACRAAVQAGLDEAQETTGTRQIAVSLPDGTVVAKVSLTEPKPAAVVTDETAFTAWVRDNHPTEVERRFVTEVRPAFATKILGEITAAGVPQWADPETGEIHDVPGVEIRATRARSHSVRFDKGGREAIGAAWRAGALAGLVLPELTSGGGES